MGDSWHEMFFHLLLFFACSFMLLVFCFLSYTVNLSADLYPVFARRYVDICLPIFDNIIIQIPSRCFMLQRKVKQLKRELCYNEQMTAENIYLPKRTNVRNIKTKIIEKTKVAVWGRVNNILWATSDDEDSGHL